MGLVEGKVIIVTGASSGIGEKTAEVLAAERENPFVKQVVRSTAQNKILKNFFIKVLPPVIISPNYSTDGW